MAKKFKVYVMDVDGCSSHYYASLKGAVKKFEAMVGWSVDNAIAEMYYFLEDAGKPLPSVDDLMKDGKWVKAVGSFGNVVSLSPLNGGV